jgi:hypothetical protein
LHLVEYLHALYLSDNLGEENAGYEIGSSTEMSSGMSSFDTESDVYSASDMQLKDSKVTQDPLPNNDLDKTKFNGVAESNIGCDLMDPKRYEIYYINFINMKKCIHLGKEINICSISRVAGYNKNDTLS